MLIWKIFLAFLVIVTYGMRCLDLIARWEDLPGTDIYTCGLI